MFDVLCFVNAFTSGSTFADCDRNGMLTVADYYCFVSAMQQGCP